MFGERLRSLRTENDYTQESLGEKLGVSPKTVGTWERGTREPPIDKINQIAAIFDTTSDYLLGRTNSRYAANTTAVDLADKNVIMSFEGRPIPPEDIELMRRLLRGSKKDDE